MDLLLKRVIYPHNLIRVQGGRLAMKLGEITIIK